MGNNHSTVINTTEEGIRVITFNNTDIVQWVPREFHFVLPGNAVEVSGLAGGGAVKVGVIYKKTGRKHFYNLYRVKDRAALYVEEVDTKAGVRCTGTDGSVEILREGKAILRSKTEFAEIRRQQGTSYWSLSTLMGDNHVTVVNDTKVAVKIITFSNLNTLEWQYKDFRNLLSDDEVNLSGSAGGGAVKVGIIYTTIGKKYIYDLFLVANDAVLFVKEVGPETGVRISGSEGGVTLLKKGNGIRENSNTDCIVTCGLKIALGDIVDSTLNRFGLKTATVINKTGIAIQIVVFGCSEDFYTDYRNVLPGDEVTVSGIRSKGVKIGVIYEMFLSKYIYDLFLVAGDGVLTVEEISSRGVCCSEREGSVEPLKKGLGINEHADTELAICTIFNNLCTALSIISSVITTVKFFVFIFNFAKAFFSKTSK